MIWEDVLLFNELGGVEGGSGLDGIGVGWVMNSGVFELWASVVSEKENGGSVGVRSG